MHHPAPSCSAPSRLTPPMTVEKVREVRDRSLENPIVIPSTPPLVISTPPSIVKAPPPVISLLSPVISTPPPTTSRDSEGCLSRLDGLSRNEVYRLVNERDPQCPIAKVVIGLLSLLHTHRPDWDDMQIQVAGLIYSVPTYTFPSLLPGSTLYGDLLDPYVHRLLTEQGTPSFVGFPASDQLLLTRDAELPNIFNPDLPVLVVGLYL
jgi:hypothetical protein